MQSFNLKVPRILLSGNICIQNQTKSILCWLYFALTLCLILFVEYLKSDPKANMPFHNNITENYIII